MRSTYREVPVVDEPSTYRITLSVLNLLAAATVVVALIVQITDRIANGVFVAEQYFSYFTIESSLGNIVVLVASGIYGLQTARDTRLLSAIRAHFLAYALITAAVYDLLLRDLPPTAGVWVSPVQWPNEVTHVWIPLYFVLDWILNPHRRRLPPWTLPLGLAFPAAWLGFTLIRGGLEGWYPYAFLNPSGEAGWGGVAVYAGGIAVVIAVSMVAAIVINLLHDRLAPSGKLAY